MKEQINILLADDHSLIRQGIIFLLEDIDIDFTVVQASSLNQIIEGVTDSKIEIAVIDAHFPEGNSLTILPELKLINPEMKILIFSGINEDDYVLKFINAGADGFLSKLSDEEEIKEALLRMIREGKYISANTQQLLLNSLLNPKVADPLSTLSERELQIAKMYAEGLGNLEIANLLELKQNTVSTVKKRIFEKLQIENLVGLIEILKDSD